MRTVFNARVDVLVGARGVRELLADKTMGANLISHAASFFSRSKSLFPAPRHNKSI